MKNAMHWETTTPCRCVNQGFVFLWVEHLHAHVNDVTGREILAFFAFAAFVDEVLKRLVHHFKVGIEQLDLFKG